MGLGALLGSNLFNGLAFVGVVAAIHPIQAPVGEIAVVLRFGVLKVLLVLPHPGVIARWRGLVLLLVYAAFVTATLPLERTGKETTT